MGQLRNFLGYNLKLERNREAGTGPRLMAIIICNLPPRSFAVIVETKVNIVTWTVEKKRDENKSDRIVAT
jgi:hypothetical protein